MAGGADSSRAAEPLVSVLICAHDAAPFIEATVRSVAGQTHRNLEILVLDNASADRTAEILARLAAEDPRIRPVPSRDNLGAYGGLNLLLDQARGAYVAIQDHDDLWHPDKLRAQLAHLETHPGDVGCGTAIVNHYEQTDRFLRRRQPAQAAVAWHTSLVFRNGPERYDLSVRVGTDFHFMRHALCGGRRRIRNLEAPYVLRRLRADGRNLSSRWIRAASSRDVFGARIGWFDKLCLIQRRLLPAAWVDRLVLDVVLRNSVLTRDQMRADPILRAFV